MFNYAFIIYIFMHDFLRKYLIAYNAFLVPFRINIVVNHILEIISMKHKRITFNCIQKLSIFTVSFNAGIRYAKKASSLERWIIEILLCYLVNRNSYEFLTMFWCCSCFSYISLKSVKKLPFLYSSSQPNLR